MATGTKSIDPLLTRVREFFGNWGTLSLDGSHDPPSTERPSEETVVKFLGRIAGLPSDGRFLVESPGPQPSGAFINGRSRAPAEGADEMDSSPWATANGHYLGELSLGYLVTGSDEPSHGRRKVYSAFLDDVRGGFTVLTTEDLTSFPMSGPDPDFRLPDHRQVSDAELMDLLALAADVAASPAPYTGHPN